MSKEVENMFSNIAGRYDLANDLLSFGMHRLWRKTVINFAGIKAGDTVVDLCTGTGDLAFELANRVGPKGKVVAIDFSKAMLDNATRKQAGKTAPEQRQIQFVHGDATATSLSTGLADATTVAFGIRNTDTPEACLEEMRRILKAGGKAIVLEFGQAVVPIFGPTFNWYSKHIMPRIGGAVTGNRAAYEYLPKTSAEFPAADKFIQLMTSCGFQRPKMKRLMGGIAYIYVAESPGPRAQQEASDVSPNRSKGPQ